MSSIDENGAILTVSITYDKLYDNTTPDTYNYTYTATDDSENSKTVIRVYEVSPHDPHLLITVIIYQQQKL